MLNVMSQASLPSTVVDSTSSSLTPPVRSAPRASRANAIAFVVASLIDTITRTISHAIPGKRTEFLKEFRAGLERSLAARNVTAAAAAPACDPE